MSLADEIEKVSKPSFERTYAETKKFFQSNPVTSELLPWMRQRTWAEGLAAIFMSRALERALVPLSLRGHFDILEALNKQSWDEVRHARYFSNFITQELGEELGTYDEKYCPNKWVLDSFYDEANRLADQGDLIQLHAGNMLVGEGGVYWAIKGMADGCEAAGIYPSLARIGRIIERDGIFHINNGRRVLARYADSEEAKQRAWKGAKYFLEVREKALSRMSVDVSTTELTDSSIGRIGKTVKKV